MPDSRKRLADGAFLLALMIYILAGISIVPPHGDEYMLTSMARDTFYMLHGDFGRMAFTPPVEPDTEQYLRLLNGTLSKTLMGLSLALTGHTEASLPQIFAWEMTLDWNRQQGRVPPDDILYIARWSSALMTALGVIPIFLLGWQLRLRSLAYPAALLYAVHPVILLDGRRAMMEGSLFLTTLLTMYWLLGIIIAEHSATDHGFIHRLRPAVRYGVLGILAGLTLASKHTGIVVVGAAMVSVLLTGLMRDRSRRPFLRTGFACLVTLLVWLALNPAYWNNPLGAFRANLAARSDLLATQSSDKNLAYTSVWQRLEAVAIEPFLATSIQYYEAPNWNGVIDKEIAAYQESSVDGWDWGIWIGAGLTVLALIGLVSLIYKAMHRDLVALAVLIWAAATVLSSLLIPLAWQRYYLPLTLVSILLAATGLGRLLVRRAAEPDPAQPAPVPASGG